MSAVSPIIRPLTGADELPLFNTLPYLRNDLHADELRDGLRRPEQLWIALLDGRVVARIGWWCRPGTDKPFLLDIFDLLPGHEAAALSLVRTAHEAVLPPEAARPLYDRILPADWRQDAEVRTGVEALVRVLEAAGARLFVERLRLEWRPGTPVPPPTGRLRFRPVAGEAELVDLMERVLTGTLDAHAQRDLRTMTARETAQLQWDEEMGAYDSPRAWWQVAELPSTGEPVGFVIPARNHYAPIIAYIGVLPEHRGHGYIDEILAEGTRVLAGEDVELIRAATDVGNTPMAASFARTGYDAFIRVLMMSWD
jgi:hypothetical protein